MTNTLAVQVPDRPASPEEYAALQAANARTPEGGAAMMVLALLVYAEDAALGRACLAQAVAPARLQPGPDGYAGQELRRRDMSLLASQMKRHPHLARAYVVGATPENGYSLPEGEMTLHASRNPYSGSEESGRVKVFISTAGADSPRPVTLTRDDPQGLWRAHEWSSLLSGVRAPLSGA